VDDYSTFFSILESFVQDIQFLFCKLGIDDIVRADCPELYILNPIKTSNCYQIRLEYLYPIFQSHPIEVSYFEVALPFGVSVMELWKSICELLVVWYKWTFSMSMGIASKHSYLYYLSIQV
jgi:hypothetical protein